MTTIAKLLSEIEQDGRFIEAHLKKMRECEAKAIEKAGPEIHKANDHWITIGQRLDAAKKKCKQAGENFEEFKEKYCPDLGRSKIYKLLAIADGRTTPEEERAKEAERKAKARSAKTVRDKDDVPDSLPAQIKVNGQAMAVDDFGPAAQAQIAEALASPEPDSADASAEARKALYAADEEETAPVLDIVSDPAWKGPEEDPDNPTTKPSWYGGEEYRYGTPTEPNKALTEFEKACDQWLPLMDDTDRKKARIYHLETWPAKYKRKRKAAA